ncbi:PREDICTED: hyaluronidase-1-like, partial [Nestor notabilis]|uniref:hyaluronidase-1-like n=1 Tax=Nestor notabilis TaxID=176057 RepID=UPI0005231DB0
PFVTIWNIPTERCAEKYNVTLNLEVFDVLANDQQSFIGQDITLFYSKELGLLPYYTSEGMPVNGGLPQNASLQAHLQQATRDIKVTLPTLPSPAYSGLAVIDWEKWRPLWVRNWASMDIYQQQSEELLNGTNKVLAYVRHRVAEAFAMQHGVLDGGIPVLPYSQIAFDCTVDFLSQEDLMNTIGESAAQGAAGIILWGSLNYSNSKEMCLRLKDYVEGPLGHYVVNVTASADLCSQTLCSGQGRCVRQEDKQGFLHLDPSSFAINLQAGKPWLLTQSLEPSDDISGLAEEFRCQCYDEWQGPRCNTQDISS